MESVIGDINTNCVYNESEKMELRIEHIHCLKMQ